MTSHVEAAAPKYTDFKLTAGVVIKALELVSKNAIRFVPTIRSLVARMAFNPSLGASTIMGLATIARSAPPPVQATAIKFKMIPIPNRKRFISLFMLFQFSLSLRPSAVGSESKSIDSKLV